MQCPASCKCHTPVSPDAEGNISIPLLLIHRRKTKPATQATCFKLPDYPNPSQLSSLSATAPTPCWPWKPPHFSGYISLPSFSESHEILPHFKPHPPSHIHPSLHIQKISDRSWAVNDFFAVMEGLLPYVYRAIVQYRCSQRLYGRLASPGDSGRFSWESAYIRLPGDSGRFASEIHEFIVDALPSSQTLYRRSASQSPSHPIHGAKEAINSSGVPVQKSGGGAAGRSVNTTVSLPPVVPASGHRIKNNWRKKIMEDVVVKNGTGSMRWRAIVGS